MDYVEFSNFLKIKMDSLMPLALKMQAALVQAEKKRALKNKKFLQRARELKQRLNDFVEQQKISENF